MSTDAHDGAGAALVAVREIHSAAEKLKGLADARRLGMLSYLLGMIVIEAEAETRALEALSVNRPLDTCS